MANMLYDFLSGAIIRPMSAMAITVADMRKKMAG